ncbi:hypothetical protein HDU82_005577 [Entophlyctis luteolus]|nr:hypothetical protein HDU82_005577 [Entophlyctis luteolus]
MAWGKRQPSTAEAGPQSEAISNKRIAKPDLHVVVTNPNGSSNEERQANDGHFSKDPTLDYDEIGYAASPSSTRRVRKSSDASNQVISELRRQLEMELNEKVVLEELNNELRSKVAGLKRKLLASIALREKESGNASKIPVSVEANMNLKYQFQKRLLMAKEDYASLLDENRKMAARIKELESNHSKREVHVSKARLNEVLLWKKKFKELEAEKRKLEENFAVFVKKLEKAEAQRDKLANDFNEAQIQFAQRLSYDDVSLENLDVIGGSNRSLNRRQSHRQSRNFKLARKSKQLSDDFEYDDVVRLQSPTAFTPKLQKAVGSYDDNEYDNQNLDSPKTEPKSDEIVRRARTQLEYNTYVKGKEKNGLKA